MKKTILLLFIFPIFLYSQNFTYQCDPKFDFSSKHWVDEKINMIYDSLNRINFNEIDFELRIWNDVYGQLFLTYDVLIMRHYIKENSWKTFYYSAFKSANKHKTIEEYFDNTEITYYSDVSSNSFVNTLIENGILTSGLPELDTFSNQLFVSHDSYYTFEFIQKECKRKYTLSESIASNFSSVKEFNQIRKLIKYRNMWLNKAWIQK